MEALQGTGTKIADGDPLTAAVVPQINPCASSSRIIHKRLRMAIVLPRKRVLDNGEGPTALEHESPSGVVGEVMSAIGSW